MNFRLRTTLLTAIMALMVWSPDASALHPAPFPHQHVPEAAPRPAEARPRREPIKPRYLPTLYAGLGIAGMAVLPESDAASLSSGLGGGGGFEIFIGWRLNPWAAIDMEWFSTFHKTNFGASTANGAAVLSGFSGLMRIYLLEPAEFEPYAVLGVGVFLASSGQSSSAMLSGPGFTGGFGADFNLNRDVSLGAKALYRGAFVDNRQGHLEGAPLETSFLNMLSVSAHARINF